MSYSGSPTTRVLLARSAAVRTHCVRNCCCHTITSQAAALRASVGFTLFAPRRQLRDRVPRSWQGALGLLSTRLTWRSPLTHRGFRTERAHPTMSSYLVGAVACPSQAQVKVTCQDRQGDNERFAVNRVRAQAVSLVRGLVTMCSTLKPLPTDRILDIEVEFYEDITPKDFQLEHFQQASQQPDAQKQQQPKARAVNKSLVITVGEFETPFHTMTLKMQCEEQTIDESMLSQVRRANERVWDCVLRCRTQHCYFGCSPSCECTPGLGEHAKSRLVVAAGRAQHLAAAQRARHQKARRQLSARRPPGKQPRCCRQHLKRRPHQHHQHQHHHRRRQAQARRKQPRRWPRHRQWWRFR